MLCRAGCSAFRDGYRRVSITASLHAASPPPLPHPRTCCIYGTLHAHFSSCFSSGALVKRVTLTRLLVLGHSSSRLDYIFPGGFSYTEAGSRLHELFWQFPAPRSFHPPPVVLDALLHVTGVGTLRTAEKVSARWRYLLEPLIWFVACSTSWSENPPRVWKQAVVRVDGLPWLHWDPWAEGKLPCRALQLGLSIIAGTRRGLWDCTTTSVPHSLSFSPSLTLNLRADFCLGSCPVSPFPSRMTKAHEVQRQCSELRSLLCCQGKTRSGEGFNTWNDDKGMARTWPFCGVTLYLFQLFHIPRLHLVFDRQPLH